MKADKMKDLKGQPCPMQHLTFGVGYEFTPKFGVHLGYMHAFEEKIKESGTDIFGQPVTIESTLSEDAVDFGLVWRF
jgi:long-chain fatty acid transport protein